MNHNHSRHPLHRLLRLAEENLAFALAGLAILSFTLSYTYAQTPSVEGTLSTPDITAAQVVAVAEASDLLIPVGSTSAYNGIYFTSKAKPGELSGWKYGTFNRNDVARISDGAHTTTDGVTYSYTLNLASPLKAGLWYISGDSETAAINGQSTNNGVDLVGATQIKLTWSNGAIAHLNHTPSNITPLTQAEKVASVTTMYLVPENSRVIVGSTRIFAPFALDTNGLTVNVKPTWKTSNSNIATIDTDGRLMALKEGVVTVTATVGKLSAAATITVLAKPVTITPTSETNNQTAPSKSISTIPTSTQNDTAIPNQSTDTTEATSDIAPSIVTDNLDGFRGVTAAVETLTSSSAISSRYLSTGRIAPSLAEIRTAVSAQNTIGQKVGVSIALSVHAIVTNFRSTFVGYTVKDEGGKVIAQQASIFKTFGRTIAGLFLGGSSPIDTIPGQGAGASDGEGLLKSEVGGDEF